MKKRWLLWLPIVLMAGCGAVSEPASVVQESVVQSTFEDADGTSAGAEQKPEESEVKSSEDATQESGQKTEQTGNRENTEKENQQERDEAMTQERIDAAIKKAGAYVDALTINSEVNVPATVVADEKKFFTWDNEKREPSSKPYLFDWSYYNGVVMEGLYDIYEEDPEKYAAYREYVKEYLDALIVTDENGRKVLSPNLAGYVEHHGADCYKTAALLVRVGIAEGNADYMQICDDLYRNLTDTSYKNSTGHIVSKEYMEEALGNNYWHSWANDKAPKYKVWLDGLYMLQPFISHYAENAKDAEQLALVQQRFNWVADTLLAPNGMYYHAANSAEDVCPFHWTRAMGWYGMAMVDVMETLPEEYMEERKAALKTFVDGMLKYQNESGLWANVADWEVTETNRLEVSGTSMMVYTILKGVRNGWLDESYEDAAVKAFVAMTELKLDEEGLHDIYLKASANNTNNYEDTKYYLTDEGKGSGPFIMAFSEMLKRGE